MAKNHISNIEAQEQNPKSADLNRLNRTGKRSRSRTRSRIKKEDLDVKKLYNMLLKEVFNHAEY